MNVVKLEEFKELLELGRDERSYTRYLKSLNHHQLETEISFLLKEFSRENQEKKSFSQARLILKEVTSRTAGPMRDKLKSMTDETFKLINDR